MLRSGAEARKAGRFLATSIAGFLVDMGVAAACLAWTGMSIWGAAVTGFGVAALFNYVLHEVWTFDRPGKGFSARRLAGFVLSSIAALATRLAVLGLLSLVLADSRFSFLLLVAAAGISLGVNYLISRVFVFRSPSMSDPSAVSSSDWRLPEFRSEVFAGRSSRYALVIPVLNEGERIRNQLKAITASAPGVDVVVADGGSTDGALDAEFLKAQHVRAVLTKTGEGRLSAQLRMAYAWCLREGYEGIVTVDGNGKDGVDAITTFVDRLEAGFDYVQGSRNLPGGTSVNTPLDREIGNRWVHAPLLSLASGYRLTDTTNGFRAYSAQFLTDPRVAPFRDIFMKYELLFYLTVRAGQLGFRICEIPVSRRYPDAGPTPTKISGIGPKLDLLTQTVRAAMGQYAP